MKKYFFLLIFVLSIFLGAIVFAQLGGPVGGLDEERICGMALTPAIGPTGICIVFGSTCIPEGWEAVRPECPPGTSPYPIAELGNCSNEAECITYCQKPENMPACLDFAETHKMMSKEEIAMARKMLELGETAGPGGCQGQAECEAYCDDISHIEECVAFAEEHDLIPPEELEEAKKVAVAIRQGITPPNCRSKTECDAYCTRPENMEECITFAEAAGLIPADELEEARKVLAAIEKGVMPPPCAGREACDEYCSLPENFETCIAFAEAAGFISPEEAAMAKRTGGKGPGDCRGKEECEAYCEDPAHAEECINFAVEFGFMSAEEAEQAKKMMAAGLTGGPGGCKGKEECEAYCNDLSHMQECVDFAEKMGFMTPEDAARARRMTEKGINVMQGGPGGCRGEEECRAFCEDPANMEECLNWMAMVGDMPAEEAEQSIKFMRRIQQGGPGGCKTPDECEAICQNPAYSEECLNFAVEVGHLTPEQAEGYRHGGPQPMGPPEETMPPEGMELPEGMMGPPSPEEIEQMKQQEMERIIQEETERMMQQQEQLGEPCTAPGTSRPCGNEIGACRIGLQICQEGVWGECFGGVEPVPEMCDGVDNDCDGQVDEDNVCIRGTQSLLELIKNFLASLISNFNKK